MTICMVGIFVVSIGLFSISLCRVAAIADAQIESLLGDGDLSKIGGEK